jgi:hypothetical protein
MVRTRFSTIAIQRLALLLTLALACGCYWTKFRSDARGRRTEYTRRQLFFLFGLVPLSSAAGDECEDAGISRAESGIGGVDILLQIGLQVGATLLAGKVCEIPANATNEEISQALACFSAVQLGAGLFGTRTVTYHCAIRETPPEAQTRSLPLPTTNVTPRPEARRATRTVAVRSQPWCATEDHRTGRAARARLGLPPDDELCAKLREAVAMQLVRSGFVVSDESSPRRFTATLTAMRTIDAETQGRTYSIVNDITVTLTFVEGSQTIVRAEARGDGTDVDGFARDAARTLVEQATTALGSR